MKILSKHKKKNDVKTKDGFVQDSIGMMTGKTLGITESASLFNMKEFYKWEFNDDEESDDRHIIHKWSRDRIKKMHGLRKSYMSFLVYSFHLTTLKSFIENFNFMVILQMILAAGAVWLFDYFDIYFNFHIGLFVSPIVFPLAFSINTDFQRREKVLDDLANFKSSSMVFFFCMREWRSASGLEEAWLKDIKQKVHSMMFNLREYLLTDKMKRRDIIARIMYEDFSDISQLIEKVRASKLPANPAIVSRSVHLLNMLCLSFERLRVIREYRSPRSIRSFNKVLILLLPIILCPYFVYLGRLGKKEISIGNWGPYYIAVLVATVFGALQGVQDKLDDPFDGMSEDDINLDTIDEWTFNSLKSAAERSIYTIGRFQVKKEQTEKPRSKSIVQMLHELEAEECPESDYEAPILKASKSPFNNRKTGKSLFRKSFNQKSKRRAVVRSQTFTGSDKWKEGRKRFSSTTSQAWAPENHPYAEVLEKMSGDSRIERKHTVRHHPIAARQQSHEPHPTPKDTDLQRKSVSEASLNTILKNENDQDSDTGEHRKSLGVKFQNETELFTYDERNSLNSGSNSRLPLLNEEKEKEEQDNRFKTTKLEMSPLKNGARFHKSVVPSMSVNSADDELTQVIVDSSPPTKEDNVFA
ncbi:uncharacterized protein [Clytia hemisphaerica]|uniref:Uncharacterized protein n=1 Tax=Clytia hemisphaerica TaxID=252671 RepID=A0A7M5UJU7_9CNID